MTKALEAFDRLITTPVTRINKGVWTDQNRKDYATILAALKRAASVRDKPARTKRTTRAAGRN